MHNKQLTSLSVSSSHPVSSFLFPQLNAVDVSKGRHQDAFCRQVIRSLMTTICAVPGSSRWIRATSSGADQYLLQMWIYCTLPLSVLHRSVHYQAHKNTASEFSWDKRPLSINKPLMVELTIDVSSVRREKETSDELMVPRKSLCLPPALPNSLWSLKRCCTFNALQPNNLSSFQFS